MPIIELESVPSTNTWAKEHSSTLAHGDVVITRNQTAGRGQRGNSWEAAPGLNLTFTLCLRPGGIAPAEQFVISEIVSLAVTDTLCAHLSECVPGHEITVKWPNDIYVGGKKIAGILIEHTITGSAITFTVAGIGLNVNQTRFLSDAPNPVSMAQLAHKEFPLGKILADITRNVSEALESPDREAIHSRYLSRLWRHDGKTHRFATPDGTQFTAEIRDVSPAGMLTLADSSGENRIFAFKEVSFIL